MARLSYQGGMAKLTCQKGHGNLKDNTHILLAATYSPGALVSSCSTWLLHYDSTLGQTLQSLQLQCLSVCLSACLSALFIAQQTRQSECLDGTTNRLTLAPNLQQQSGSLPTIASRVQIYRWRRRRRFRIDRGPLRGSWSLGTNRIHGKKCMISRQNFYNVSNFTENSRKEFRKFMGHTDIISRCCANANEKISEQRIFTTLSQDSRQSMSTT